MFRFVVRHLRWLSRIPGLPQLFDAMLVAWTALFHRRRLAAIEAIEVAALKLPGMQLRVHRFGGVEFAISGREVGHLHGNGLLDVRVGCELARALIAARRAEPHHVLGESAWISFWVRSMENVPNATQLLETGADIRTRQAPRSIETATSVDPAGPPILQSPRKTP